MAERRGKRDHNNLPKLNLAQILAWADAHHRRTGHWPRHNSGFILDAPGQTWLSVESALRLGSRGLPGGSSLAKLLREHRASGRRQK